MFHHVKCLFFFQLIFLSYKPFLTSSINEFLKSLVVMCLMMAITTYFGHIRMDEDDNNHLPGHVRVDNGHNDHLPGHVRVDEGDLEGREDGDILDQLTVGQVP